MAPNDTALVIVSAFQYLGFNIASAGARDRGGHNRVHYSILCLFWVSIAVFSGIIARRKPMEYPICLVALIV